MYFVLVDLEMHSSERLHHYFCASLSLVRKHLPQLQSMVSNQRKNSHLDY